ncbi:hypothetical protein Tco_1042739 [Tanacetum coccineum]|uniref:Uncharacterized protein n=1 Tax=Tanacetum coccineum TaxID=301880 RepID=A0ABQ5GKM6_9ASTR
MDNVRPRASYSPIKRSYYTRPSVRPKDLKQDVKTSRVKNMTTVGTRAVVNTGKANNKNGNPKICLQDHAVVDSGCSGHMTSNKAYLSTLIVYNGGLSAFWMEITLSSFTDTECLILSPSFKLLDENQVVLRAPRQNGVYNLDLKNIVPSEVRILKYTTKEPKEIKETKQTLGHVVLTLVKKVKSLEVALKRMSKRVILSDSEDEETENQGRKIQDIDNDPLVSLIRESMKEKEADFASHTKASASGEAQEDDLSPTILEATQILSQVVSQSVSTYKRKTRSANKGKDIGIGMDFFSAAKERLNFAKVEVNTEVNPGSAGVNTGNTPVSTPSVIQTVNVIVPSPVKSQRERKAPMTLEDVQATQKTKEQIRQEEAGLTEAMRLQALQDEEDVIQVH